MMKKRLMTVVLAAVFALVLSSPLFAVTTWNELTAQLEKREMVRTEGTRYLSELKKEAPAVSEFELWKMLWVGDPHSRAVAGVALMDSVFPGGDPGRWEDASGFLRGTTYRPRQLAAMDAFFVTVAALDGIPGGEWTAALLLEQFTDSGRGQLKFIDEIPRGLDARINSVAQKTGMSGEWSYKTQASPLPLLPQYGGNMTRDTAESRQLQYIDGSGRLAQNGYYAWDRDRGYIYKIMEGGNRSWRLSD